MPIGIKGHSFFSKNLDAIKLAGFSTLISEYKIWKMFYNKNETFDFAKKININIPETISLSESNYESEIKKSDIKFKMVIKSAKEGGARYLYQI